MPLVVLDIDYTIIILLNKFLFFFSGLQRKQFDDILAKSNFPDNEQIRKTKSGTLKARN